MPLFFMRTLRNCVLALIGAATPVAAGTAQAQGQDAFEPQRKRMVEEIAALTRETRFDTGRASLSERVMGAIAKVPRHEFVPARSGAMPTPTARCRSARARRFRSPSSSR